MTPDKAFHNYNQALQNFEYAEPEYVYVACYQLLSAELLLDLVIKNVH